MDHAVEAKVETDQRGELKSVNCSQGVIPLPRLRSPVPVLDRSVRPTLVSGLHKQIPHRKKEPGISSGLSLSLVPSPRYIAKLDQLTACKPIQAPASAMAVPAKLTRGTLSATSQKLRAPPAFETGTAVTTNVPKLPVAV